MGVSINWLKDYVKFSWTPEELAHRLTMAGIAIEGVEKKGEDSILELDLTPNRGDCLGIINLAREVAALTGEAVKLPTVEIKENSENIKQYITVEIKDPELCPRYAARVVKNVQIKPSPAWMQERLLNSGIRPINNIVDITNYVMLESNQPLHAFDYDLLNMAKKIVVRRAAPGEILVTLDGVERVLNQDMLLITDAGKGVALAGIMGGENTEINDTTVNVLLESACFSASNIRRSSKKLGLRSDSSIRFEKGSDINGVIFAVNRAAALIQELAGGEVISGICDQYPAPLVSQPIGLRPERVNQVLGTSLETSQIRGYLEKLGFGVAEKEILLVQVPTYRPDISMEVDLIEEVARLYGYNNIPANLPWGPNTQGGLNDIQKFRRDLSTAMASIMYEVINYSFVTPRYFDMLLIPSNSPLREVVQVANPLSEEQSVMRTLLLPGLLDTLRRNLARKNNSLAFFEIGSVFYPQETNLPNEVLKIGAAVAGSLEVNWLKNNVEMDFFYLKGILENILQRIGISQLVFEEADDPSYHPGRSALVKANGTLLGVIGEIHPSVRQNFDIKPRACAFELDVNTLFALSAPRKMNAEIARYPAVERDLAVIVNQEVKAAQLLETIESYAGDYLQNIEVFDIYSGEQVPEDYKSIALRITFRSLEKTLTEDEVNSNIEAILQGLRQNLQATLR